MLYRYVAERYEVSWSQYDTPESVYEREDTPCAFCGGYSVVHVCPGHGVIHNCGCVHLPDDQKEPSGLVPVCVWCMGAVEGRWYWFRQGLPPDDGCVGPVRDGGAGDTTDRTGCEGCREGTSSGRAEGQPPSRSDQDHDVVFTIKAELVPKLDAWRHELDQKVAETQLRVGQWLHGKSMGRGVQQVVKDGLEQRDPADPNCAMGGGYTYSFTPTPHGCVVKVRNTQTDDEIDLTDYDSL